MPTEIQFPDERLVFLDLEVAGGEPWRPIIQLAAIAVDSRLDELERLEIKLRFRHRDADARSLFGSRYSPEVWREEAISECCALEQLSALLRRHATVDQVVAHGRVIQVAQIVAHNSAFDAAVLMHWFDAYERFMPASQRFLCTMQRAIWLIHEDKSLTPPPDYRLTTLARYFGVPLRNGDAHDAMKDVEATVGIYLSLIHI